MASVQAAAEMAKSQQAAAPPPPAPAPPAPAPAPAPAPPPPPPAPEPAAPPPPPPAPEPPAAEPPPPAPEPEAPAEMAPEAPPAPQPGEDPLIYEAALRVLMAKQSAWQSSVPRPSLKTRLLQRFRPQLELADRGLNNVQTKVSTASHKTRPYVSVILAIPIGLVLIWTGYRLAKALLLLPR